MNRSRLAAILAATVTVLTLTGTGIRARADDGYSSPFAQAVRTATQTYRLSLWARDNRYVQTTDYVDGVGIMYTNHDRFNPPDLAHPSMLVYDEGGRLVACGYQFTVGTAYPAAFAAVPSDAWYDIPRHVHYNALSAGQLHYGQAPWPNDEQPTAESLRKQGLLPDGATLEFAFVHPAVKAIVVWAWLPNADGLFAGENALMP